MVCSKYVIKKAESNFLFYDHSDRGIKICFKLFNRMLFILKAISSNILTIIFDVIY